MATQTKNRLGDILISKGLITPEQLNIAIGEQKKRRQHLAPHDMDAQASIAPLGEVLIELGFIDNMQLKRGLGWQSVVRKVTLAMSLCAPLMTVSYQAVAATVALPTKIEAESYSAMSGVYNEPTTDVGGGQDTGNINTNDWMSYKNTSINIPATGSYKITYRVASLSGGGKLELREAGAGKSYDSVSVPSTGGWQNWTTITRTVTLPAGVHNFEINALSGGFNVNWFQIEKVASSSSSSSSSSKAAVSSSSSSKAAVSSSSSSAPAVASSSSSKAASVAAVASSAAPAPVASSSSSAAPAFSQTIQAENYTSMSGVYNEATTDVGGGQDTGNINTGDWMSFSGTTVNIPATGTYKISYRVASLSAGGSLLLQESATSATLDTVTVPVTGGWQTWVTVERTITLSAGTHSFNIKAASGGFNVNWFKIESAGAAAGTASSSASSTPAAVASSSATPVVSSSSSTAPVVVPSSSSSKAASSSSSSTAPVVVSSSSSSKAAVSSSSSSTPIASSSSSSSAPSTAAFSKTIEAENYTTMSGVYNEATADVGGGQDTGNIDTNDWMSYSGTSVSIPTTGTYKISYRVASLNGGGSFSFKESATGASYDTVSVPSTGGWQNWVTVERTVTLTAGTHAFDIAAITGGFNVNWFKIESVAAPLDVTIQTENYSGMSGVYNEPTTDVGGGQDTGNIDAGDWLVYAGTAVNVPVSGNYTVSYRVASLNGGGSFSLLEAGGTVPYDTVSVPYTGGWQNWSTITRTISLTAGVHYFGITAITGGFNLNWFSIKNVDSSTATGGTASGGTAGGGSVTTSSVSSSSKPATTISSSSSSTASFSSSSSSTPSTTSTSGVVTSQVTGPVSMGWIAPKLRQNGTVLDITEIAGYEIRYKLATDANFTYISINDAWTNTYNFAWLEGNYVFQIAAFDKDGLYSDFVDVVSK